MKKILILATITTLFIGSSMIIKSNRNIEIPNNINSNQENKISNESNETKENNNNDDYIVIQGSMSYYTKYYNTIEDLIHDSSVIIKGKVINTTGIVNQNGTISTDLEIKIDSVLDGEIENNDIIKLRSRGGIIDYDNYIKNVDTKILEKTGLTETQNHPQKIVNYADGIKQYEIGDSIILFLDEYDSNIEINPEKFSENDIKNNNLTENKYVIVGDTQGKFYYDKSTNEIFRYKLAEEINEATTFDANSNKELKLNFEEFKNML